MQRNPAHRPPGVENFSLGSDLARGRVLLFSRIASGLGQVWEWDGWDWTERRPAAGPSGSDWRMTAFDAARSRLVMFGGVNIPAASTTWEYYVPCDSAGPGHVAGGLALACATRPVIATSFCLSFPSASGESLLAVGTAPAFAPPLVIHPPVMCETGFVYPLPWALLHARGNPARYCLAIPAEPALFGRSLCLQGFALETGPCLRAT